MHVQDESESLHFAQFLLDVTQLYFLIYYYYLFLSILKQYQSNIIQSNLIPNPVNCVKSCHHVNILPLNLWDFYPTWSNDELKSCIVTSSSATEVQGSPSTSCAPMGGGMILSQILTFQSTIFQSCCHIKISPLNLWDFYPTWANKDLKSCIKLLAALPQRHKAAHLLRRPQWAGA